MPVSESHAPSITSDRFREVIGHFPTGVTVITAVEDGKYLGTTASAVTSVSLEPPMLLVCMNRRSSTGACVSRIRRFGVSLLGEGQADLAARFARSGGDKFKGVDVVMGCFGEPLLDGALAHLECEVFQDVSAGTHSVYVATVKQAWLGAGRPLAYFRGQFGRLQLPGSAISSGGR